MMNKKGISIGRILLYVLFLSLIALFIWTLYVTFKAMKKKTNDNSINSSLRFAYNNDFEYSGADYINSTYLNFYNNTESIAISVFLGTIPVNVTNGVYTDFGLIQNQDFLTVMAPYSSYSTSGLAPYSVYSTYDNSYSISSAMKQLYSQAVDAQFLDSSDELVSYNYFTDFRTNGNLFASAALVINCNIPVPMFDFTLNGVNITGSGYFYVSSYTSNYSSTYVCSIDSSNRFVHTSLPSAFLSNFDTINRIIIPVYQSYRSVEDDFYIINNSYNYDYNSVISSTTFNVSLDFDIFTRSTSYQDGYNNGYSDGVQAADTSLRDYNSQLITQVNSLSNQVESLNSRINQQSEIITQLNNQLQQSNNNFKGLFFTFADIPFKTVSNALGFEFWGVNLFRFFVGIITALGILWLIKRLYK